MPSILADLETPTSLFLKLAPLKPAFLLESVVQGEQLGRYSFIGLPASTRLTPPVPGAPWKLHCVT